jgi:hypothetical protein
MKIKKYLILGVCGVLLVLCCGMVVFHETFFGLYICKLTNWEEDAFLNKSVLEVRQALEGKNQHLFASDSSSFYAHTHVRLESGQQVMFFVKGKAYPWFRIGSASNVGYVVVNSGPDGGKVVRIVRAVHVDSL